MAGHTFLVGNMGDAQETLEYILSFIHREYVYPNYLEEYVESNSENKFKLANKVEDMGCTPKCAAH